MFNFFRLLIAMSLNSSGPAQLLSEIKISECGNLTDEYTLVRKKSGFYWNFAHTEWGEGG